MAQSCAYRLPVTRRRLLIGGAAFGGTVLGGRVPSGPAAPGVVTSDGTRPQVPCGVMSGDPTGGRAIIWSKTDRPARMLVEYATREDFRDAQRVAGPAALAVSDYTARVDLGPLPLGGQIFYRVTFQDLADLKTLSAPAPGMLRMPSGDKRNITFAYSGDEAGQGWGINPEWGGYRLYETMRRHSPDFFIHSGDQIYADNPIVGEVKTDDGKVWSNLTTEGKSKVAETLDEFRAAFAYNLLDENKRRFAAETAFLVQWDDHETRNNWYSPPRRRFSCNGTTTRPATIGTPDSSSVSTHTKSKAPPCCRPTPARRCSNRTLCALPVKMPSGFTGASPMVRRSTFSCSTSDRIAVRIRPTASRY